MKIEFEIDKKTYTLEYARDSIRRLEEMGYNFQELEKKPFTLMSVLFFGALLKNHPAMDIQTSDKLYNEVADEDLLKELDAMFATCIKFGGAKNPNVKWKKVN